MWQDNCKVFPGFRAYTEACKGARKEEMTKIDTKPLVHLLNTILPKGTEDSKTSPDNCVMCGHFIPDNYFNGWHCPKCIELLDAEQTEAEIGIGNGQICYVDEDYCRHCLRKWPMSETVYNAVYGMEKLRNEY